VTSSVKISHPREQTELSG